MTTTLITAPLCLKEDVALRTPLDPREAFSFVRRELRVLLELVTDKGHMDDERLEAIAIASSTAYLRVQALRFACEAIALRERVQDAQVLCIQVNAVAVAALAPDHLPRCPGGDYHMAFMELQDDLAEMMDALAELNHSARNGEG
jgi:hypothetical protein